MTAFPEVLELSEQKTAPPASQGIPPLTLNVRSVGLTDEQFFRLCGDNRDLRLELTAHDEMIVMTPAGSETGRRNGELTYQLVAWAKRDGTGIAFDSSSGFTLANGAKLSPDASWIGRERWSPLSEKERERFAPICPDFVAELRSVTDNLATLQAKMAEWIENGARLGCLLDPHNRQVYVYRPGEPMEQLENPTTVDGSPVLPGFRLDMRDLW